jgi:hypothetical protein
MVMENISFQELDIPGNAKLALVLGSPDADLSSTGVIYCTDRACKMGRFHFLDLLTIAGFHYDAPDWANFGQV